MLADVRQAGRNIGDGIFARRKLQRQLAERQAEKDKSTELAEYELMKYQLGNIEGGTILAGEPGGAVHDMQALPIDLSNQPNAGQVIGKNANSSDEHVPGKVYYDTLAELKAGGADIGDPAVRAVADEREQLAKMEYEHIKSTGKEKTEEEEKRRKRAELDAQIQAESDYLADESNKSLWTEASWDKAMTTGKLSDLRESTSFSIEDFTTSPTIHRIYTKESIGAFKDYYNKTGKLLMDKLVYNTKDTSEKDTNNKTKAEVARLDNKIKTYNDKLKRITYTQDGERLVVEGKEDEAADIQGKIETLENEKLRLLGEKQEAIPGDQESADAFFDRLIDEFGMTEDEAYEELLKHYQTQ